MYDTINFKLSAEDVPDVNFLQEVPCNLVEATIGFHDFNGEQVITGNVGGLRVTINRHQIKVKDGSLCKWYLGNNFRVMGRGDTQRAIEQLSDTLHLPMSKATITRLDIAQNFILQHPPSVYLNHLGMLKYAKRLEEPDGLYYSRNGEMACFYDKNKEQQAKGVKIPKLYKNKNVLRYELRYTNRIASRLQVDEVRAYMLYDENFYIQLIQRWHDTYKAIDKINDIISNLGEMKTVQDLHNTSIRFLIDNIGELKFISFIKGLQKMGKITAKQAFDIKKAMKKACEEKGGATMQNEAITELDKKIIEAVRYYR